MDFLQDFNASARRQSLIELAPYDAKKQAYDSSFDR